MAKRKRAAKSKPANKPRIRLLRKVKSEFSGFLSKDDEKIMLEILCEKMIKDLGSILTRIEDHKMKSSNEYVYERKKDLLKSIIFSNKVKDDQQLKHIRYQLVRVLFWFKT